MIEQRSAEWVEARRKLLTASDFAAALGIHPYRSRQKLWRLKVGLEVVHENAHIARGVALEPLAIHAYEVARGVLVDEAGLVLHPTELWLGCSPDGYVGADGLIEAKCPAQIRDEPPAYHVAQVLGQLEITGRAWCDYTQYVEGEIRVTRIERDSEWWAAALPQLREFWDFVLRLEQPPRRTR